VVVTFISSLEQSTVLTMTEGNRIKTLERSEHARTYGGPQMS